MVTVSDPLRTDLRSRTLVSYLDLARWVAAAVVFLGHLRNPLFLGYSSVDPASQTLFVKLWYFVTGLHAEAVIVFFVLSGLLVAGVGVERIRNSSFDTKGYSIDRFSRLYVAFLPALLLCFTTDVVGSTFLGEVGYWNHTHPMIAEKVSAEPFADNLDLTTLVLNGIMLQGFWVSPVGSNHPLWTISAEFWFYVIFGLAAIAFMFNGVKRNIGLIAFGLVFIFLGWRFPILLGYWLIGMALVWIPRPKWIGPIFGLAVFAVVLCVARLWHADFDSSVLLRTTKNYVVALAFAVTVVSIRGRKIWLLERTAVISKILADFSYSLYLLHFPLMLFILAVIYILFGFNGIASGYSPTSFEGRTIYLGVIVSVYLLSWLFSRMTEARTMSVRKYLKCKLLNHSS